jgi:hypothetical protein
MRSAHTKTPDVSVAHPTSGWMRVVLVLLVIEKVIQHITVTLALYLDLGGIRAQLALDYRVFLLVGAMEAALFAVGVWGLLANKRWTPWLLITLALLDIAGEFVAQGTLSITITVSILVAFALLCLSLLYWRVQH